MTLFICLKKFPDDYDVVMASGDPVLFVVSRVNDNDSVVLEDENVNDLSSELEARFATAVEEQWDELYFFMDLLDTGFTLADINKYCPEKYEYSKKFMEEHGLISDVIDDETGEKYDPKDFVIETCPVCGREEVIRIKGVSRCRCGYPLAPCSVCESCDYAIVLMAATAPKRILRSHVTMMRFLTAFRKNCMHYFKNTPKKNLPGSSFFCRISHTKFSFHIVSVNIFGFERRIYYVRNDFKN